MSNLSEEEILDKLTNPKKYPLIEIIRKFKREGIENFIITRSEYIKDLLDLYKELKQDYIDLDKECREEKEKNKELVNPSNLQLSYYDVNGKARIFLNGFISKNKIEDKIKEIDELLPSIDYHDIKDKQEREFYKKEYMQYVTTKNALQELLEEE